MEESECGWEVLDIALKDGDVYVLPGIVGLMAELEDERTADGEVLERLRADVLEIVTAEDEGLFVLLDGARLVDELEVIRLRLRLVLVLNIRRVDEDELNPEQVPKLD